MLGLSILIENIFGRRGNMKNYKIYKNYKGEHCYKLQMEWRDDSQPDWRGTHCEAEELIPVGDCLVWDVVLKDFKEYDDFLNDWTETTICNQINGDWDDISDISWSLELLQ